MGSGRGASVREKNITSPNWHFSDFGMCTGWGDCKSWRSEVESSDSEEREHGLYRPQIGEDNFGHSQNVEHEQMGARNLGTRFGSIKLGHEIRA